MHIDFNLAGIELVGDEFLCSPHSRARIGYVEPMLVHRRVLRFYAWLCGDSAAMPMINSSLDPDEFSSVWSRLVWCANISSYLLNPPGEDNDTLPAR
jgi:hypothetical protein